MGATNYAGKGLANASKDDSPIVARQSLCRINYGHVTMQADSKPFARNTEYADFNWEKCTLHVLPKPWRHFRLKRKKKKKSAKGRFIPIPAKLVWKIKDRMRERSAQPHDLVFPNGNGKPSGHFLRKLKAIAKKAGIEGAELHRCLKTYADTLHEEGVSVNTIRIRLGLAYLKDKDAESEEAQEHANSSSLALYA